MINDVVLGYSDTIFINYPRPHLVTVDFIATPGYKWWYVSSIFPGPPAPANIPTTINQNLEINWKGKQATTRYKLEVE